MKIFRLFFLIVTGWISSVTLLPTAMAATVNDTSDIFDCRRVDPILGGGFKPNCTSHWERRQQDKVLFNVEFSTDEYGRRITPGQSGKNKNNLIIFFGCSFTLGASVNNNETVPYYFSEQADTFNVYNYGGSGFGPQQMLATLTETDITTQVTHVNGRQIGIYQFLAFHVQRAVGKPSVYNWFGKYFPYYVLNEQNELVRQGNFETGRPTLAKIYSFFKKYPPLERVLIMLTERPTDSDIRLTARIIEESAKSFNKKFTNGEFVVVVYPGSKTASTQRLLPYLKAANIRVLDYSTLVNIKNPGAHIEGDGHPSPQTHRKVAIALAKDLGITPR